MFFAIYSSMCDYFILIDLMSCKLTMITLYSSGVLFGFLVCSIGYSRPLFVSFTNKDRFISSNLDALYFLSSCVLARTPNIMMNRSYESRHHFPIFSIWEEKWSFSMQLLALGFSLVPFTGLRKLPFIPHFTGRFYQDWI